MIKELNDKTLVNLLAEILDLSCDRLDLNCISRSNHKDSTNQDEMISSLIEDIICGHYGTISETVEKIWDAEERISESVLTDVKDYVCAILYEDIYGQIKIERKYCVERSKEEISDALRYSKSNAKKILKMFNERGWNFYLSQGTDANKTIKDGIAGKILKLNEHYVLLPIAENPKDPKQVFEALENLARKLHREMPTITINNEKMPLTGLTLEEDFVKLHTPPGTKVDYITFVLAIESAINAN